MLHGTVWFLVGPAAETILDPFEANACRTIALDDISALAHVRLGWVLGRVEHCIPARVQLARVLSEAGRQEEIAGMVVAIRSFAPKHDLAAAGRMFPHPEGKDRRRLYGASECGRVVHGTA